MLMFLRSNPSNVADTAQIQTSFMFRILRRTAVVACFWIASSTAVLLLPEMTAAQPPKEPLAVKAPEGVLLERDLEYGRVGDRVLRLDIVRPKKESDRPRPVVAYIHGGGWRSGDKSSALGPLMVLADRFDYVCASIGYRLTGEAIWPAQIHDCKAAIRWIKAQATKYNLDPNKIAVWGHSAGGHLVSLLGTSGDVAALEGNEGTLNQSSRVACVLDFSGPTDFLTIAEGKPEDWVIRGPESAVGYLLGGAVEDKKDVAKAASPVTYVSADDPPFLIMHGTKDALVPYAQAEELAAALAKVHVPVTLVRIEGGGHGFGGDEVNHRTLAFLERWLRGRDITVSSEPIPAEPPAAKH